MHILVTWTALKSEFLSDLIPECKPGGRPREVNLWEVINAIFYILVEGCRWRALPGDFPAWQTVYTYFRNWRKDGTWVHIHDRLRDWTRIEQNRQPSPSEVIIDSQSVKSAAIVSQEVGFDRGKLIKGRKRFLTVDTLGLVLRVLVAAASTGERQGGKQILKRVKSMGCMSVPSPYCLGWWRLWWCTVHDLGDGRLPLDCTGRATTNAILRGLCCSKSGGTRCVPSAGWWVVAD